MKIIVTGGCGFIGSNLVRRLLTIGYKVLNIDTITYAGSLKNLSNISNQSNYNFKKINICDYDKIKKIFYSFKPDYIMHLAAETHVDNSIDDPSKFIETNIFGTYNLLMASNEYYMNYSINKNFRFIHISTDEVYGSANNNENFHEYSPYKTNSPYSASKASSDHLARAWNKTYNLPTVITNCSNNFGPNQHKEKLIPKTIISLLENKEISIYGNGKNKRDWIYVEDHITALIEILKFSKSGSKYNISTGKSIENIFVVKKICNFLDKKFYKNKKNSFSKNISFVKDRPGHDLIYSINCSKIFKDYKWKAETPFNKALEKTIDWYISNYKL